MIETDGQHSQEVKRPLGLSFEAWMRATDDQRKIIRRDVYNAARGAKV